MHRGLAETSLSACLVFVLIVLVSHAITLSFSPSVIRAQNEELVILSSGGYLMPVEGYYRVVGEIQNLGEKNFTNVALNVTFRDLDGNVLTILKIQASLSVVGPNRTSPFVCLLTNKTQASLVKSHEVSITGFSETVGKEGSLRIGVHKHDNSSLYGILENNGWDTRFAFIYAVLYDTNKEVVEIAGAEVIPTGGGTVIERASVNPYEVPLPLYEVEGKNIFGRARYYSLTGESLNYSVASEIRYADFIPPPFAVFSFSPESGIKVGQTVTFNASQSFDQDGQIILYKWDFGDNLTDQATIPTTTHTYASVGNYTVVLTLRDNSGLESYAALQVTVEPEDPGDPNIIFYWFALLVGMSAVILFSAVAIARSRRKGRLRRERRMRRKTDNV